MKILTVSNCPLVESQGSGYVTVNYCQGLRQLGHQVDAFGPEDYEPLRSWRGRATSYRYALGMALCTLGQLRRQHYDMVECYGGEAWLTIWLLRRWWRRMLVVSHSNGLEPYVTETMRQAARDGILADPLGRWYQFDQSALFTTAFTQVHGLVTVSERERDYALEQGYQAADHVVAIENPLLPEYLDLPLHLERSPMIGYCGSWIPRKGIALIQQDITRILVDQPASQLTLVGVGDGFRLGDWFPPSLHDRITVIPYLHDKGALRQLYQQWAILIAPAVYESFGLTVAEAMACGCAVVTSKTGFGAALADQKNAMVLNRLRSPALYDAVYTLLSHDSLRRAVATAGHQRVQALRWSAAIDRLAATYQRWFAELHPGTPGGNGIG